MARVVLFGVTVVLFCACAGSAGAGTLTWSGLGGDGKWGTAKNWAASESEAGALPADGDELLFPNASKTNYTVENDLTGLTLSRLNFTGAGGTVTVTGNPFTLDCVVGKKDHAIKLTAGGNVTIENDIELATGRQVLYSPNQSYLTLNGVISGAGTLVKTGDLIQDDCSYYALVLNTANTYTGGTEIKQGILRANHAHACGDPTKEIYFNRKWRDGTGSGLGGYCTLRVGTSDPFPYPLRTYDSINAPLWGGNTFIVSHVAPAVSAITLTGPVTGGHFDINAYTTFAESSGATAASVTFTGPVTTRGMMIYGGNGSNAVTFQGAVTNRDASILGPYFTTGSNIRFCSDQNEFNGYSIGGATQWYVQCYGANVLNHAVFNFSNTNKKKSNALYLRGVSQVIDRVIDSGYSTDGHTVNSDGAAVLTMQATASATNNFTSFTGNLSLVWDPTGDFDFVCQSNATSTAVGTITVKRGTFRTMHANKFTGMTNLVIAAGACADIANTSPGAFAGLKAATIGAGGSLALTNAVSPFTSLIVDLTVEGTDETCGKLVIADADETVTLRKVFYGSGVAIGWYTGADSVEGATKVPWITGAGKVYVAASTEDCAEATWTGGAGKDDTKTTTGANWSDPTIATKLDKGTAALTFATGGGEAKVVGAMDVQSMTFETAHTNAFTFAKVSDESLIGLESGGLTFGARTATGTYEAIAPVAIHAGQTWTMGANTVFKPSGGVKKGNALAGSVLALTGTGKVVLPGSGTTYDQAWEISGVVDAYGPDPFGPGTEPVTVLDDQAQTTVNLYNDITFTRPFVGRKGEVKRYSLELKTTGQTIRFQNTVDLDLRIKMNANTHVIFEGGGTVAIMPEENNGTPGSTIEFSGTKPYTIDFMESETRFVNICFNVASNKAEWIKGWYAQDYTFNVDWAFYEGNTRLVTQLTTKYGTGHCDLKGTRQRVSYAGGNNRLCWYTNSAEKAATVYMTCRQVYTNATPFKGEINLVKEGGKTYRFATNVVSTSTGVITNFGGRIEFAKEATWGGRAVSLDATADSADAALALEETAAFPRQVAFTLIDGESKKAKIELGEGVVQRASSLTINGARHTFGSWGSSASSAANKDDDHFSGKGVIRLRTGTYIILR